MSGQEKWDLGKQKANIGCFRDPEQVGENGQHWALGKLRLPGVGNSTVIFKLE